MSEKLKQMKNRINPRKLTYKQKRTQIRVELSLLAVLTIIFVFVAYEDYKERPGLLKPEDVVAVERNTDSITLEWKNNRNTDTYSLYYKQRGVEFSDWTKIVIEDDPKDEAISCQLDGLKEGTDYRVVVRADNKARKGFLTDGRYYSTRKKQEITSRDSITKLDSSEEFYLAASAETNVTYESTDSSIATVDETSGKVSINGTGTATIKIQAEEDEQYAEASKEVKIIVLSPADKDDVHIIYKLDPNNCDVIKTVTGDGNVDIPQGLAYTGDEYIIAYGMSDSQRIISFGVDNNEKSISTPKIALGHPNGFTYCDKTGLCYSVKGWSTRAVTYNPKSGEYGTINFKYGCSGIGYDRVNEVFYTSSRNAMRAYSSDGEYESLKYTAAVNHSGKVYTQDCGGHAGIMFHCISGSNRHGTNYIDLYDMVNETYLGTLECSLSEVESVAVDKDGYLLILANYSSKEDYIYKTTINIEDIAIK